ncbi:MAG: TolC family protein [Bryobacteraceae bacterium]|jgi:outer membrane protein TolC
MIHHSARSLIVGLGLCAAAFAQTPPESLPPGVRATQLPLSGVPTQGASQGSVPTAQTPGAPLSLSLDDAVQRGLKSNLGAVGFQQMLRHSEAQGTIDRSFLLPQLNGSLTGVDTQTDLAALGFSSFKVNVPGFTFPTVLGPYHYFDLRAGVSQSILDATRLNTLRATQQNTKAVQFSAQDVRDLIALAVTSAYLQVVSGGARVDSARAQVATAQATYQQAADRHDAGVAARIDVTRSQVELQTEQQRLTSVENDLAKQKIAFGRLIGLPPAQEFTLTDALPFAPLNDITIEQALARATANRADIKAAEAQIHAAELTKRAAQAERLPSISVGADYGVIGVNPTNSHGTFDVTGSVRMPIWNGHRVQGDVEQADAALEQRRAEYQDLRGRIDAEIRTAFLDLNSAATQVKVADSNRTLAADTLQQARDRFAAGVADTVEVVQAQEAVAAAEQDYIGSLYTHNLAKATLARSMGQADQNIKEFLGKQ